MEYHLKRLDKNYKCLQSSMKWHTYEGESVNRSQKLVMDIVGFPYVSIGSSTFQLHDSQGSTCACPCSEAGFSNQNGECTWAYYCKNTVLFCVFCGQEYSVERIFIKKCFLFIVGSVYRVKRFTAGWLRFFWWRRGWNEGAEVAETAVKRLLCYGFRRTGKAMGPVYQSWWRICREIKVRPCLNNMIYELYPFVVYLLALFRS
jgi:hypothetical protein